MSGDTDFQAISLSDDDFVAAGSEPTNLDNIDLDTPVLEAIDDQQQEQTTKNPQQFEALSLSDNDQDDSGSSKDDVQPTNTPQSTDTNVLSNDELALLSGDAQNNDALEDTLNNASPTSLESSSNNTGEIVASSSSSAAAASSSGFTPVRFEGTPQSSDFVSCFSNVRVQKGEKTAEGYVRYSVMAKTSLDDYASKDLLVTRRYSDFVWLQEQLYQHHKSAVIPPLPEKAFNPLGSGDERFLEHRRRELERFLQRVTTHPTLSGDSSLKVFLEASETELKAIQEEKPVESMASKLGSFFGSAFSSIAASAAPETFGAAVENDPWFESNADYTKQMRRALSRVASASNQLIRKHQQTANAYNQFKLACELASSVEESHSPSTCAAFKRLSEISNKVSMLESQIASQMEVDWEDTFRDHSRLFQSMEKLLEYRTEQLARYQTASRNVTSKNEMLLKANGSKADALRKEIEHDSASEQVKKDRFEQVSAEAKSEIERVQRIHNQDMKVAFSKFSQSQVNHQVQLLDMFKKLLSESCD